jgi:hypothetical protein
MAESYPLTLPAQGIASISLVAENRVAISESPFTYKQQVIRHAGQRFRANISYPPMNRAEAEEVISFLLRLRGMYGTFSMGDPSGSTARGSASSSPGSPVVASNGQTGDELDISGATTSTTNYLRAGDYIQVGSYIYKVLEDVDTDSSGDATLNIWPSLRDYPNGSSIVISNPKSLFRLSDNQTNWSVDMARIYGVAFSAVEAL